MRGPVGWPSSAAPRGTGAVGRRISRRYSCACGIWPMRGRVSAISGFGSCSVVKVGWSIANGSGDSLASMACNCACGAGGAKHIAVHRGPAPVPVGPTERWSMDCVHDTLADGRPFRILTFVDNWSRSSPVLEAGFRMSGEIVGQVLDRVLSEGPAPRSITVDHGTEFQSRALEDWAYRPARRMPERPSVRVTGRCAGRYRSVAD